MSSLIGGLLRQLTQDDRGLFASPRPVERSGFDGALDAPRDRNPTAPAIGRATGRRRPGPRSACGLDRYAVKPAREVALDMVTGYADVVDRFAREAADAR